MKARGIALLALAFVLVPVSAFSVPGGAYSYRFTLQGHGLDPKDKTVIGFPTRYIVKKKDTLLDIARNHGLGFNELADLYPDVDPWVPPQGKELVIPSVWVLPRAKKEGIMINLPEFRLFYFMKQVGMVKTYPVGIGDEGWDTPVGTFWIATKTVRPTWYVPESLQAKYGTKVVPPGPENPLGDYWMGLGRTSYGIHGTNFPWAVGRLVTHGCIRLYPEDMERFFPMIEKGTPVEIVYEPVKFGTASGRIYVEVHRDIYRKVKDFLIYGWSRLAEKGLVDKVDRLKFQRALERQDGLPVDITLRRLSLGG